MNKALPVPRANTPRCGRALRLALLYSLLCSVAAAEDPQVEKVAEQGLPLPR